MRTAQVTCERGYLWVQRQASALEEAHISARNGPPLRVKCLAVEPRGDIGHEGRDVVHARL